MEIQYSVENSDISDPDRKKIFRDKLTELIVQLIMQIAFIPSPEEFFENLVRDELGLARALNFTDIAIGVENILGDNPKLRISEWRPDGNTDFLPIRRSACWNSEITKPATTEKLDLISPKPGENDSLPDLQNFNVMKHRDRKIFSLININLWDRAGWSATGFGLIPNLHLPFLALLFQNETASKNIFTQWREELGVKDLEEQLRVSIITGIDTDNPAAYRMVIGINPNWSKITDNTKSSQFIVMSRINTMDPRDSQNLDQFLTTFNKTRAYVLVAGHVSKNNSCSNIYMELGLLKHQIFVRPAWQIEEHDLDIGGLQYDDKVIIPVDIEDPPVVRALACLREMESKRSSEK
jgi:hypothetical protein